MSMFRRRLLMQQAMSVPDPIAKYDPTGHTNEDMAEYSVLTDLTGNGHDISCNNFAWSGMSGIGGYNVNFNGCSSDWNLKNGLVEFSYNKIVAKNAGNQPLWTMAYLSNKRIRPFTININGLTEGKSLYVRYRLVVGGETTTILNNVFNGTYQIPIDEENVNLLSFILNGYSENEDLNVTIEQLPLYGNALVSDGVDDYGICENFPILTKEKGYTVVAVRKILNTIDVNSCFIIQGDDSDWSFATNLFYSNWNIVRNWGNNIPVGNVAPNDLFVYQNSKTYNGIKDLTIGDKEGLSQDLNLFSLHTNYLPMSVALYSLEIYDRDLTPYQIEAVKKRLMDKYNNPEDTTSDWYGVEWYTNQSPSRVMRIGNMNLHRTLPIQSGMYRCILNDNGEEVYKLDPNDSTKKEDGTPAVLDGTDGNVMVYIPVFYARFESKGYRRRVKLSDHYKPGFIKMGGCYVSAYEATVDRTISTLIKLASVVNTTADFRGGNNNAEWDSTYRSLLGMPATSISLTNFRNYARNRKDGDTQWNCMDYTAYKAVYWLYVVEYADRNCQLAFNENLTSEGFRQGGLGSGVTNINSTKWNSFNSYHPFVPCGHTNRLGNKTGRVQFIMPFEYDAGGAANYAGAYSAETAYTDGQFVSDGQELYECIADAAAGTALSDTTYFTHVPRTSTNVPSYRGIENIFGHLFKWTDGVHIKVQSEEAGGKSILYTSDNPANYQDTDYEGYEEKGYVARSNGYVRDIIFGRDGYFYVSEDGTTGGSSTTYFSDYAYTNVPESGEQLRGLLLGGRALHGSAAGLVFVYSYNGPAATDASAGFRLCYIPNN